MTTDTAADLETFEPVFDEDLERARDRDEPTERAEALPGEGADDEAEAGRGGRARSVNARLVARRSIEKYQRLTQEPSSDLAAAALVVGGGVKADAADIAVFVTTTARADLRLLDRVDLIASAPDAFEAMSTVMALDSAEARRVWELLRELAVVEGRAAPKTSDIAKGIARAALGKAPEVLRATERVRAILRK
ncbi:hypothetical protein [Curtobacterium sp. 20TX0008]|uniref:hypothetical protein n=1 Tax=Curtobacterium sp. 20TX0008 TaxID=3022018 RepID=UPI00232FBE55|nr:hypothetical protein [Curtobacterium sp. 20TX0008]MDB6425864.1 hypothetical protein [Curtobacterium sp. 20TX0008]